MPGLADPGPGSPESGTDSEIVPILHVHELPRWMGDTNFMTTVAETRVLNEPLAVTWAKVREAWPEV